MTRVAVAGSLSGRRTVLLVLIAALAALIVHVPGANGAYIATVPNSTNNSATNPWFTCTNYSTSRAIGPAYFSYPLGESATVTASGTSVSLASVSDVSGNGNNGSYSLLGVTGGQAGAACRRDATTAVSLSGGTGNVDTATSAIYGPNTTQTNPTNFTEEIWFRTTTTTGGNLISFGDAHTGSSGANDRHLYLDNSGHVVFGVFPGSVVNILSSSTYNNGSWHFAVASLSSTAGMALYVDGTPVASNSRVTSAQNYAGYWRIGYDNLSGWGSTTPTTYHVIGQLAWASVYNSTLSATTVAQQYAAGS